MKTAVALLLALVAEATGGYRVQSDAILFVIEGTPAVLGPRAHPLARATEGTPPMDAQVLLDLKSGSDDCGAEGGGLAEPMVSRVIAVRPPLGTPAAAGVPTRDAASAWDAAYRALDRSDAIGAMAEALRDSGADVVAIEPDLWWTDTDSLPPPGPQTNAAPGAGATHAISALPDRHWPEPSNPLWHLEASQLADARTLVEQHLPADPQRVRIAHFDTGYPSCADAGLPPHLLREQSWDFTAVSCPGQCDPTPGAEEPATSNGTVGHGTGTLSILAGGRIRATLGDGTMLDDALGGAPFAEVVEYRIDDTVDVWRPSRVARALEAAIEHGVDIVSMSMGGPPSFTLARVVNRAYCNGVAMFTATGNNLRHAWFWPSTPRTTVFPARFDRVVGVAGITADDQTYARAPWRWDYLTNPCQSVMRGNTGPLGVMREALVAFTPNVAWLDPPGPGCLTHSMRLNGAGTSAATPQAAAAAAAWLQYHRDALAKDWRSWRKAEAVYRALLDTADDRRPQPPGDVARFGTGALRAAEAIRYGVPTDLRVRPRAVMGWTWLVELLLFTVGPGPLRTDDAAHRLTLRNMLATEIAQRATDDPASAAILDSAEDPPDSTAARRGALARLRDDPMASTTLRELARRALERPDL